jgi:hypothetical protein
MTTKLVNGQRVGVSSAELTALQTEWTKTPPIEDLRASAVLSRAAFLTACEAASIISAADAEEAADGSWPSSFDSFLTSLTLAQRIEAKSTWADNTVVRRNNPLLAQIAAAQTPPVTEAQLDLMFGIA